VDTVLSRYFALPVVPTVFGFDARIQLLHSADALAVLELATLQDKPGVFNVGSDGVMTLSQAIRRAGRIELPMPRSVMPSVGKLLRGARVVDFSADQVRLLNFGRVVDTKRLKQVFGYTPRWTTREAFDDFIVGRGLRPVLDGDRLASLANKVVVAAATGQAVTK
jgi:UDP-glucose 4-epimerase